MNLRKCLFEVLKTYTGQNEISEIKTMTQSEIYDRLDECYPGEGITLKRVRTCLKNIIKEEENLPDEEKTICYKEYYINGKKGREKELRRTDYYYNRSSERLSDVELKYLIDSIMYGEIFNSEQAKSFAKRVQNLSGKNLKDITPYVNDSFGKQRFTLKTDVLQNIDIILKAIKQGKWISFEWNVYDVADGMVKLRKINERIAKPIRLILNEGRYYAHVRHKDKKKVYTYSVDLMKEIKIVSGFQDGIREDEIQRNFERAKYLLQTPYNFTGEISTYRLRVRKEYFSRLVDTFSYGIQIIDGTETDKTVEVKVKASENGMVYWLLHHYDVAELIGNKDGKLKQDLKEAVEKLYERYCLCEE